MTTFDTALGMVGVLLFVGGVLWLFVGQREQGTAQEMSPVALTFLGLALTFLGFAGFAGPVLLDFLRFLEVMA